MLHSLLLVCPSVPVPVQDDLVQDIRALVLERAERDAFSGAVLVALGDEILLEMAVGEAEKRFHSPNTIETRFNLGSMNKMFTAVAAAQLVEQGKIGWDDPISRWVDESWLPREVTDGITVRQLATHTSGLGSYFDETFERTSRAHLRAIDDYKLLVRAERPGFEPGTRWSYSNTGMLLLGVVIEKAAGQDYYAYIREHVYAPAGMTRTDCYEMDQPVENLAIGYERDATAETGWRNNLYQHVIKGGPAGGGFSTVRDLHRFAQALVDGKLLSVSSLDLLWTDHAGAHYGYGFGVQDDPVKIVGHSGGFPGISANLDVFLESGHVVAVLSNHGMAAAELSQRIRERVVTATTR